MIKRVWKKKLAFLKKSFSRSEKSTLAKLAEEQIAKVGSLGQEIVLMKMAR